MELKAELVKSGVTPFSGITVTYGDETILFKGSGRVNCGTSSDDLFECFNSYVSNLSEDTRSDLFDLYKDAKLILDPTYFDSENLDDELMLNNNDYHFLTRKLKPTVKKIFDTIKFANFEYFIAQSGYVNPPPDLMSMYARGEYPPETTINFNDYRNLGQLILVLRCILPVIVETVSKAEVIAGKGYAEVIAGLLINDNPVVVNHPGWVRLNEYVEYSYNAKGRSTNPLRLDIISEDRFANHAVYKALFSRLCLCFIPSKVPNKNLSKSLYSIVNQFDKVSSSIREKRAGGKDENNDRRGHFEIYQLKEEVNATEEAAQAEYFSFGMYDEDDNPRHTNFFKYQCAGLGIDEPALAEHLYSMIPNNWEFELRPHIVKLCQLVFADDISYMIYYALEYQQLMAAMALAQLKLHQMGYPHLAVLVTAIPDKEGVRTHTEDMFSLTTQERAVLQSLCAVVKGNGAVSTDNEAVSAAMEFFKELGVGAWKSTIELGLIDDPKAMETMRKGFLYEVELTKEIKEEFIALVAKVNEPDAVIGE